MQRKLDRGNSKLISSTPPKKARKKVKAYEGHFEQDENPETSFQFSEKAKNI